MEDFKKFTLLDESQRSKIATDSTKMEPTKEDKPDFSKITLEYKWIVDGRQHMAFVTGCEKIWNDYVIPITQKASYYTFIEQQKVIKERDAKIAELENELKDALDLKEGHGPTALSMLSAENERLKSELDKAITYLSKTYRYLNADSVLREEIENFLKDKR